MKVWGKAGQRASRTARGKRPQPHHACNPGPSPPRPGQTVTPRHCPPHRADRGACVEGPRGLTRQRAAGSDLGCCAGECFRLTARRMRLRARASGRWMVEGPLWASTRRQTGGRAVCVCVYVYYVNERGDLHLGPLPSCRAVGFGTPFPGAAAPSVARGAGAGWPAPSLSNAARM